MVYLLKVFKGSFLKMSLTGSELLAKVKELGDVGKSEIVRSCGYVSSKKDGGERLNFTAFYEALLGWTPTGDEGSQNEMRIGEVGNIIVRGGNVLVLLVFHAFETVCTLLDQPPDRGADEGQNCADGCDERADRLPRNVERFW